MKILKVEDIYKYNILNFVKGVVERIYLFVYVVN